MSSNKLKENISKNHLTEAQLVSYQEGTMSMAEMHAVESHMLECDFCKDAAEGFSFTNNTDSAKIIDELRNKISKQITPVKMVQRRWRFALAASILLIVGIGITFLLITPLKENTDLVVQKSSADSGNIGPENGGSLSNANEKNPPYSMIDSDEQEEQLKKLKYEDDFVGENSELNLALSEKPVGDLSSKDKESSSPVFENKEETFVKKESEINPSVFARKSSIISGKVTDEAGEPLAGTIINIAGTNITSVSNANGQYSIASPNVTDTLIFNNLGYEKAEVAFNENDKKINTKLFPDTTSMGLVAVADNEYRQEKRNAPPAAPSTVLKTKKPLIVSQGNKNQISGTVFSKGGHPLPGVSVQIKGSSEGAVTDNNGSYSLSLPTSSANLVFSSQGYNTEEVEVSSTSAQTNVILNENHSSLSKISKSNSRNYPPVPRVGISEYNKYLKENLKYTDAAKSNGVEGNAVVEVFIEKDGTLSGIKIIKGLGYGLDEEAIRLIKNGPSWKPGRKNGEDIRQRVTLNVPFSLN